MHRPSSLVQVEAAQLPAGPSGRSDPSGAPSSPLHQVFQLLDEDGGGTLSLREFREGEVRILGTANLDMSSTTCKPIVYRGNCLPASNGMADGVGYEYNGS